MKTARVHFVAASTSLSVAAAGASAYMLLSGEAGSVRFAAWTVAIAGFAYPALVAAMRSESQDVCSRWLRRMADA